MESTEAKVAAAALGTAGEPSASPRAQEGGRKLFQYLGAMSACLFAVCMGTTMGWTSAASRLQEPSYRGLHITESEYTLIGAAMPLGAIASALPTGPAITRWGRRSMMLLLSPIIFLSWLLVIFASAAWMMILARIIIGFGIGSISLIAPLYSSEIAHKSVRGTLGSFFQFLHTCGVLLAYVLGWAIVDLTWISVCCGCVPLVAGCAFFFFPDTPTWYLQQGRVHDARKALVKFRGEDYPEELLQAELDDISAELRAAEESKKSLKEAFTTREAKLGLVLSLDLMFIQQLSGVSAAIFYADKLFQAAGSSIPSEVCSIIMGACLAVATAVAVCLVDRLGRRILLLLSGLGCVLCNVILGVYLYLLKYYNDQPEVMSPYGVIPILTMGMFMVLFSIGFGPIPWSYTAEVFLIDIRSTAMSIATITNWILVFIVTVSYGPLEKQVGGYTTFWMFAAITLAGTVVVALFLVETKGKSPQQIQEALSGKKRGETNTA